MSRSRSWPQTSRSRLVLGYLQVDVIVYKKNKRGTHRVRAVVRTAAQGEYSGIVDAMSDVDKRNFVLAQALIQLNAFKRRYRLLSELAAVFEAIDRIQAA